jgi:hypothetical protein
MSLSGRRESRRSEKSILQRLNAIKEEFRGGIDSWLLGVLVDTFDIQCRAQAALWLRCVAARLPGAASCAGEPDPAAGGDWA